MDVEYAGSLLLSRRPPRMCFMTAFRHAGCEHLLPSLILALVIELGLQRILGTVSTSDMFPVILSMTGSVTGVLATAVGIKKSLKVMGLGKYLSTKEQQNLKLALSR